MVMLISICLISIIFLSYFEADPYRYGALALFNVCDPDTAAMFDTGRGHTIPRSGQIIRELGNAVRDLVDKAYEV
jgi:hypothetical protein